jgi:hypothetical protein
MQGFRRATAIGLLFYEASLHPMYLPLLKIEKEHIRRLKLSYSPLI